MIRALIITLCLLAFATEAKKPVPPSPPPPSDGVVWQNVGVVAGVTGSYTPVVQLGGSQIRVYGNTNGVTDGNLYLQVGSWTGVGSAQTVLDIQDARDTFIRTNAVVLGASGTYYALLYTGDGYPTQGGYSSSWATSPDGIAWTWWGMISPFGRNQSSAMNLIVDESRTDAYRFMFWMDLPSGLMLVHSGDGASWSSDGVGVWPIVGDSPQFCGATKTPHGYHMVCANTYPATALRHIFSCTGFPPWRVLEMASEILDTTIRKGANLTFDPATDTIHALVSGRHWTLPASPAVPYPC